MCPFSSGVLIALEDVCELKAGEATQFLSLQIKNAENGAHEIIMQSEQDLRVPRSYIAKEMEGKS